MPICMRQIVSINQLSFWMYSIRIKSKQELFEFISVQTNYMTLMVCVSFRFVLFLSHKIVIIAIIFEIPELV